MYYMAENLEIRRDEIAGRIQLMTGRKLEECVTEVDLSIQRLFHWGAYCDKYGGGVQVCTMLSNYLKCVYNMISFINLCWICVLSLF